MALANYVPLILVHTAGWDPGGWGGNWWIWRLVMFLFWIVFVAVVVWFVRRNWYHDPSGLNRARGILAERYARDEISAEEYRERLDNLR